MYLPTFKSGTCKYQSTQGFKALILDPDCHFLAQVLACLGTPIPGVPCPYPYLAITLAVPAQSARGWLRTYLLAPCTAVLGCCTIRTIPQCIARNDKGRYLVVTTLEAAGANTVPFISIFTDASTPYFLRLALFHAPHP